MKENYELRNPSDKIEIKLEKEVIESLKEMSQYTKHTQDAIVNVALKRFISQHKDFFPAKKPKT